MTLLVYDGTLDGFLTAIFHGFTLKGQCYDIVRETADESLLPGLFEQRQVESDPALSDRVYTAVRNKLSTETYNHVYRAWLSRQTGIELEICRFLKLSFHHGRDISDMLQSPVVHRVVKTSQAVGGEAHRMLGLLRFHLQGGVYVADIRPDYEILPLITSHFVERFGSQPFVIRDRHYGQALVHYREKSAILPMKEFPPMEEVGDGDVFEQMWKHYYKALTIEERKNPRIMQQHMPKKYWKTILEKSS